MTDMIAFAAPVDQGNDREAVKLSLAEAALDQNELIDVDHYANAVLTLLSTRIAEAVAALEPFARQNPHKSEAGSHGILVPVTIADVRRARAALGNLTKGGGE